MCFPRDQPGQGTMRKLRSFVGVAALGLTLSSSIALVGCAVDKEDLRHWESTLNGPFKLNAVLSHDKYSWDLRAEAAMSLIRMKTRGGQKVGLDTFISGYKNNEGTRDGGLQQLAPDSRAKIIEAITPRLIEQMKQPLPTKGPDGKMPPDPSIPYKDAAFALLSNETTLVTDEKIKAALRDAVLGWVQTNFEARVDYSGQQFGVEQIMRHPLFGAPAVKPLPQFIREDGTKNDRVVLLVTDLGDADSKKAAGEALVKLAKRIDSKEWHDQQKPLVEEANVKRNAKPEKKEFDKQLDSYQEQELEKVFANMKRLGGTGVVDFALSYAASAGKEKEESRIRAIASVEGRLDKNSGAQLEKIFNLVKNDDNPDKVRGLALARLGEFPKEQVLPKLYTLFEGKKWQVRLDSARMALKTMNTKDLGDFMRRLPQSEKVPMALSEPIAYAAMIGEMSGPPPPREVLKPYLDSKELGPKLVALSVYYQGKKPDAMSVLSRFEEDRQLVSKCKDEESCGWKCSVPKGPGPKDTEEKVIVTIGDYVKFCLEPSLK